MEDSFGINAVALVDGQPRTLGLKELLEVFLGHRYDVVRRRSVYRRGKAADRLHLVDGLLIAILDIDEVIQLIRTSDNAAAAKERLIAVFDLSARCRPTTSSTCRCAGSRGSPASSWRRSATSSLATIAALDEILADETRLRGVVSDELAEVAKTFGTPRRTVLLESAGAAAVAAATVAARGRRRPVLRLPLLLRPAGAHAPTPTRPGSGGGRAKHDVVVSAVRATARGEIGGLTSAGRLVKIGVLELPQLPRHRQRPAPRRRRTRHRGRWSSSPVSGCWPSARWRPRARVWRSAPGRAS